MSSTNIPGKYYERTKPHAYSASGTNGPNHCISTNDDDNRIIVEVLKESRYLILAKGSYQGLAFCIVNVWLSLVNVDSGEVIYQENIYPSYNYNGLVNKVIKFVTTKKLKKGSRIELRFGNENLSAGASNIQQAFYFAEIGDFISMQELN